MPFYNDYNIGESMPEEMIDMFTGPKQYDDVMQGMATQLFEKQKLGYLNSLKRSFTKIPYTMLITTEDIKEPIVTASGDVNVKQLSELMS